MMIAWNKFRRMLSAFSAARGGNVVITFAIATLPIMGSVGAAIDYSRANSVKAAMQTALDSTALMLSKEAATDTSDQLKENALKYFTAIFSRPEAKDIKVEVVYNTTGGSKIQVDAYASIPAAFMGILGFDKFTVKASSTSKWGITRLRVALALDNTGSMAWDGKMDALKDATKNLLTQLKNAATTSEDVYVSIIPFSKDVRIDNSASNYNANWMDFTSWENRNGNCTGYSSEKKPKTKSSCEKNDGTWTPDNRSTWIGCITDRGDSGAPSADDYDRNVLPPDASIKASQYPAEQYSNCPLKMMGLNNDWTSMNSLVESMFPAGNTNQPIGLVWGWLSLVGGGPLSVPAKDTNYKYQDIIILMSDGLNTEDRWYSSQSSVDKRMLDTSTGQGTCPNAKAAGITIYTIHVNTGGDPLSTLLRDCASSPDKFWMVTSSGDLGTVFTTIGTALTKLRIAN